MKRSLSLSDIGNLAEAIAAVGVIISLVYLAVQIRQNTHAMKAASYQDLAEGITDWQSQIVQNESLARIYLQGVEDPNKLAQEEQLRFEMFIGNIFAKFDVAVDLYQRHMIDEKAMTPYTRVILSMLEAPGVADWWKTSQSFFSDDLRSYINAQIGFE